nr:PREDICTED: uncharacterized protein LOC105662533 [Megachile rotundata]
MSLKWNEGLVISFLKTYKQHPCLWNPYHRNYYNCHEKNAALRKIIDALDIPGFTVNDYLQQIKIIREKYKQEQARTIKCIQSQKHYKSPFPWYNIVAEMLMEVINEEERANSGIENYNTPLVLKSLSSDNIKGSQSKEKTKTETKTVRLDPCTDATCDGIIRRSKSMEKSIRGKHRGSTTNKNDGYQSNVRIRYIPCSQFKKENNTLRDKKEITLLNDKSIKDTDPAVNESDKCYEPGFLRCPVCGWESANDDQCVRNVEKPMDTQKNFIPCASYSKDPTGKTYMICTECNQVTRDDVSYESEYMKKYVNNSGDFELLQDLSKQVPCPTLTNRFTETELTRPPVELVAKTKRVVDIGVQCEETTERLSKIGTSVSVPTQTQIFKLDPVSANKFQGNMIEACLKIMLSGSQGNTKENATSPVLQSIQVDQCIRPESKSKETQFPPKDTIDKTRTNESEINAVNYADIGIQNTICKCDERTRCISLQTDEKENSRDNKSMIYQTRSKGISVNMIDKVTRGIQSTICVSRGDLFSNRSSDRTEIGTNTTSAYQVCSVACVTTENVMQLCSKAVPCILDKKNIPVTRAKSAGSINYCVQHTDLRKSTETGTQEYTEPCRVDTCPRNPMHLIKKDSTIALLLQQLLCNILISKYEQNTCRIKSSSSNTQTDGRCTIDVSEILNKIREDTIRILGLDVGVATKNEANEFYQKFNANTPSQETKEKTVSTNTESPTFYASTLTMTNDNDSKLMSKSTITKQDETQQVSNYNIQLTKETNTKFSNVDKEILVLPNSKDINGSLTQLLARDVNEQTVQNKISVGTQKRDPILVRLIKCSENQGIVKSDKETLTTCPGIDVSVDKRAETCGRSTCTSYVINRKKRENLMDNDYCKRSVMFNNYICDQNCKDKANSNWTDVANVDVCFNKSTSKIPLGIKSHKCAINRRW